MSGRAPNYRLKNAYKIPSKDAEAPTLPERTYVRPINFEYVPKHVLDDPQWRWYSEFEYTFCHTKYGIMPIPTSYLEEA